MKRKIIIFIVILVIAAAGLTYYVATFDLPSLNTTPTPTASPSTSGVASKTYTNAAYGISFAYPQDYFVIEKDLPTGQAGVGNAQRKHFNIMVLEDNQTNRDLRDGKLQNTEAPPGITLDIYQNNLDKLPVLTWIKNNSNSNYKLSNEVITSSTVGGKEALGYTWDGLYRGDNVVFAHADNIVAITVTYNSSDERNKKEVVSLLASMQLSQVAASASPSTTPKVSVSPSSSTTIEPAAAAARKDLATRLKISENAVTIVKVEQRVWSNGCLDLAKEGEACTMVLVNGFMVTLSANSKTYIYHTNSTGSQVGLME
jgi:hypothetical protein